MSDETKEIRGDAPRDLVNALDALALTEGMTRVAYVNRVLTQHVQVVAAKHILVNRMCKGNPLFADNAGLTPD